MIRPLQDYSLFPISCPLPFLEPHDFIHYFIIASHEAKHFVMMLLNACVVCLKTKKMLQ